MVNVISFFSGAGGSSQGYKMAGCNVLYANEFIPIAAETYKLNHKNTYVDTRDIRDVQPEEIKKIVKCEIDIVDGSPPCSAFSIAGIREKGWGVEKNYSETKQVVDDLFYEYIRMVEGLQPKIFIAENVDGLIRGKAKGYFIDIIKKMKSIGYNVKAKVLNAKYLEVPQSRKRLIFIGVRKDLKKEPVFPKPINKRISVKEAVKGVKPAIYKPISGTIKGIYDNLRVGETSYDYGKRIGIKLSGVGRKKINFNRPSFTITTQYSDFLHPTEKRYMSIEELKRICSFPDDYKLIGSYSQQFERLGRAVPPKMMYYIAKSAMGVL